MDAVTAPTPSSDPADPSPGIAGPGGTRPAPLDDLVSTAHETRVAVVGGGIAGLVAALECAKLGLRVTLLERAAEPGGTIRSGEVGGAVVDLGPDGWAGAGGAVRRLVDELGLGERVVPASGEGAWIAGAPFGAAPLPADAVLGIPGNPWDPGVRRIIGWGGVWRAYLDRLRPPLTIGAQRNLDRLVRGRMGDAVADRLVAPLSVGRYGLAPAEVDVEVAAPGLSAALTRTGSLGGAVAQLLGERTGGYETLDGGLAQLVEALDVRLSELGVDVRLEAVVEGIERGERDTAPARARWLVAVAGDERPLAVDAVVVAASESEARRLLAPVVSGVVATGARDAGIAQTVVTLVVAQPALDAHPRGSVVYPLPASSPVASVVHATARWPWLVALGAGVHVLRVSFPPGVEPADAAATAVAEASALLTVPLPPEAVRGARIERFVHVPPASALGRSAASDAVRAAVHAVDGLAVAGAWVAGSGLAAVVADAVMAAERVRRIALWGDAAELE